MALRIVWTKRAVRGYDAILQYLIENWTEKEVKHFLDESDEFFRLLVEYPEFLQKTGRQKNVYRGPMNKLTVVTYRVKPRKQHIEIINVRGARQKPSK